jgi:hypothetical protein
LLVHETDSFSQISVWPKLGTNISWTTFNNNSGNGHLTMQPGLGVYGGVSIDIPLSRLLSLKPEVIHNQINVSWRREEPNAYLITRDEQRRYLSVPINLVYHIKFGKGEIQFGIGSYLSLALNGGDYNETIVVNQPDGDPNVVIFSDTLIAGKVPLPWATNPSYYNLLDFGFNTGLAYQINRFLFSTQFGLGLTNTQPHYVAYTESYRGQVETKNRCFSFGLSYRVL